MIINHRLPLGPHVLYIYLMAQQNDAGGVALLQGTLTPLWNKEGVQWRLTFQYYG